jgi:SAM-dependent methyltransferase
MLHDPSSATTKAQLVPAYDRYAEFYDRIGQRSFGEKIAEATLAYLLARNQRPATAVDLACGTGAATLVLARSGIAVTGADRSAAMLDRAAGAAATACIEVAWLEQDMRDLRLPHPVELITCFYDGINYLTTVDDLTLTFASVLDALLPGGLFVFDANTRVKFASNWNESIYIAADNPDLFGIYRSWFEPATGLSPLVITFFVRRLDDTWDRFDEEHVERAHDLDEIQRELLSAGFELVDLLDYRDHEPKFGGAGSERSHRVVFVARRPASAASEPETRSCTP